MKQLVFKKAEGLVYGETPQGATVTSTSMEKVLAQLAPHAPEDKLQAAAEILDGLFGESGHVTVITGLRDA